MGEDRCCECGKTTHGRDSVCVSSGSKETGRLLCCACYNREIAERVGITFQHPDFKPMELVDANGIEHRFFFATRLLGDKLCIDAYEESLEGYEFQVLGDALDDPMERFQELLGKMRRALNRRHLVYEEGRRHISGESVVRGRISWDDETDGLVPLLSIDGRPVTWNEFGRMLMTFEGWQFRLEIFDISDEP
jgi:hypothetical protein